MILLNQSEPHHILTTAVAHTETAPSLIYPLITFCTKDHEANLKILIVILGQWHSGSSGKFSLIFLFGRLIELEFRRLKGRSLNKVKLIVSRQLPRQPKEWLLKVVV